MMAPFAFIEALPGQWLRAGLIIGMEAGEDGRAVVMFQTPAATSSLAHKFSDRFAAERWLGDLRHDLTAPVSEPDSERA